ncbi:MAG: CatA-like O-acetyltransferase, partial [Bacteroidota bacterium]
SFFLYYLHKSLRAANELEAFRYRIVEDKVIIFDQIDAASTIGRPNGTFGFSHMEYYEDFLEFEQYANQEVQKVRNGSGLNLTSPKENVIHYSAAPWIKFTALSHARHFSHKDSCPKIAFGKMTTSGGRKEMPVSIHAHHALMDGFHVGQYIERFQKLMNEEL